MSGKRDDDDNYHQVASSSCYPLKKIRTAIVIGFLVMNPRIWLMLVTFGVTVYYLTCVLVGASRPWWFTAITISLEVATLVMGFYKGKKQE